MKTVLWTVDLNSGLRMYVSASTVLVAVKNAVWGNNKDDSYMKITAKDITMVCRGRK